MKWVTRKHVKVDRSACPWLVTTFIDPDPEFLFVAAERVLAVADRQKAIPYDVPGVELGHHGGECSFEAMLKKFRLTHDPALVLMGKIVNGADTDNSLWGRPESAGLRAIAEGFRHMGYGNDYEQNEVEWVVYDALYAYCRQTVGLGRRRGMPAHALPR